jgi:hypothetical protein
MNAGRLSRITGLILATGGLLAAGLTGCTDEGPEPPTPRPTSASPTTPPSPTPAHPPPVAPTAERTAKSAEAFVKYFWDVYNYSYATENFRELERISSPDCIFCQDTKMAIQDLLRQKSHIRGATIAMKVAIAPPSDPAAGLIVETVIDEQPSQTVTTDGSVVRSTDGIRDMKSEIALDWRTGKWIVRDVANDERTGRPW